MLSLPCGPEYKTMAIATMGDENILQLSSELGKYNLAIADCLKPGGALSILLKIIDSISPLKFPNLKSIAYTN